MDESLQAKFDFEKTYYMAGPMSGLPDYNYPAFTENCAVLRGYGIKILSPHEEPWPPLADEMTKNHLWDYMMAATRELLERADGIILIPGWCWNKGALKELDIVREAYLPVWYYEPYSGQLVDMRL